MSAMPAPVNFRKPDGASKSQDIDAKVLSAKLEQHQRKSQFVEPQPSLFESKRAKRAIYVPQNAAAQFTATTTPRPIAEDLKRATSTKERRKPSFTADGKPCINPKQLRAALTQGMTESEACDAIVDVPQRKSPSSSASGDEKSRRRRTQLIPSAMPTFDLRRQQQTAAVAPAMRSYKPGDAAKRRSGVIDKRSSAILASQTQGKLIAVHHGFHTTYEREYNVELANGLRHDSAIADDHGDELPFRPRLMKPHDRVNWAQESQCGEDMHTLLHSLKVRRKSSKTASDRDEARRALEGTSVPTSTVPGAVPASKAPKRPGMGKKSKSANDVHEEKLARECLVSDAVKMIKKEEKAKRRTSFFAFFRRS